MNSHGPSWKWITGILVGALLSFLSYSAMRLEERVTAEENKSISFTAAQAEIHALIDSRFNETFRRLDRIEKMLDNTGTSSNHGFPTTKR